MKRINHALTASIEPLEQRMMLTAVSWKSDSSGFWDNPGNWSNNAVPQAGDDVTIDRGAVVNAGLVITVRDARSAASIQNKATLTIADASLNMTGTLNNVAGATLNVSGNSTIAGGSVNNGGTLNETGAGTFGDSSSLLNTGTVHVQAGTFQISAAGTSSGSFIVDAGGTMLVSADYSIGTGATWNGSGQYYIASFGQVTLKNAAVNVMPLNFQMDPFCTLSGPGSLEIPSGGTFNWFGGAQNGGGNTTIDAGASADIRDVSFGESMDSRTMNNSGSVTWRDSQISLSGNAVIDNKAGGTWTVTAGNPTINGGTFKNEGNIVSTGTGFATFSTLINSGTVAANVGSIAVGGGSGSGRFFASNGAGIYFNGFVTNYQVNAGSSWDGDGMYYVVQKSTVTLDAAAHLIVKNLDFSSNINGAGTIEIPAGGTFLFDGIHEEFLSLSGQNTLTGSGTLKIDAGAVATVNEVVSISGPLINGWTVDNFGTINMDNTSLNDNGVLSASLNNEVGGVINSRTGNNFLNLRTYNSGRINNLATATGLTLQSFNMNYAGGVIDAQGTHTITLYPGGNFGSLLSESGAKIFITGGEYDMNPGGTLDGAGDFQSFSPIKLTDASVNIAPQLFHLSSLINGPGSITVASGSTFFMNGGNLSITGHVHVLPGGTFTNDADTGFSAGTIGSGVFDNDGVFNLKGTGSLTFLTVERGEIFNNNADGQFNILATTPTINGQFDPIFNNFGIINRSVGTGVATFNMPLNNVNTVTVNSGNLSVSGAISQFIGNTLTGGTWNILNGSKMTSFNSNIYNMNVNAATITLDGFGAACDFLNNVSVNSGTINVLNGATFTTSPAITNPGVRPALPLTNSGHITIGVGSTVTSSAEFKQTATGILEIQIGDTSASNGFGKLISTGAAALDGTLRLSLVNAFLPPSPDTYAVLSYPSKTGDFATFKGMAPLFAANPHATNYTLDVTGNINGADLATTIVTATPPSVTPGQTLNIHYTVGNLSSIATDVSTWQDSVYISPTANLDPLTFTLVGRFVHNGALAGHTNYSGDISIPAPSMANGTYFVIVVADSLHDVSDIIPNDNTLVSSAFQLIPPTITLGTPFNGTISNNQDQYFRLDIPGGSPVTLTLNTALLSEGELYVSHNELPTRAESDQFVFDPTATTQKINLPGDEPGTYFILIHGRAAAGAGKAFTLTASTIPFGLTTSAPQHGETNGKATITLTGAQFTTDTVVSLVPSGGGAPIFAGPILVLSNSTLSATFDLTGVAPGQYDITAFNDPDTQTLAGAFTVDPVQIPPSQDVSVLLTAPLRIRTGPRETFVTVDYYNNTGHDITAPLLTISATNAQIEFHAMDPDDEFDFGTVAVPAGGTAVTFLGINQGPGAPGILPPHYHGTLTIPIMSLLVSAVDSIVYESSVAYTDVPVDLSAFSPYLKPDSMSQPEWDAIFQQIVTDIGPTQGDYINALGRDANLLPASMGDNRDPLDLLQIDVARARAELGGSISGRTVGFDSSVFLSGHTIYAVSATTNTLYGGTILNDGSFFIANLPEDDYTFEVSGYQVLGAPLVTVADGLPITNLPLLVGQSGRIQGNVKDALTGLSIANVSVNAYADDGTEYSASPSEEGTFAIDALPPGTYTLVFDSPGTARTFVNNVQVGLVGTTFIDVSMGAPATISGSVSLEASGPQDSPILVTAQLTGTTDLSYQYIGTVNGNNYTLGGLPGGTYDITFSAHGFISQVLASNTVSPAGSINRFGVLAKAGTISGKLTSTDPDVPAGNQSVDAYLNGSIVAFGITDADGNYTISALDVGDYTLVVPGASSFFVPPVVSITSGLDVTGVDISLAPGGVIRGEVKSGVVGMPNIVVSAIGADGNLVSVSTDSSGFYEFDHLAQGNFQVSVGMPGAPPQMVSIASLDPIIHVADFSVDTSTKITGYLQLIGGAPVHTGFVFLLSNGHIVASAATDANGAYTFYLPVGATYAMQAVADNATFDQIASVTVAQGNTVTQNFTAGSGSLHVQVSDPGNDLTGATVELIQKSTGQSLGTQTVAADGSVTFVNLVPGDYGITVLGNNNHGAVIDPTVGTGLATVTVPAALQGTLSGTVTSAGNIPLDQIQLVLYSVDGVFSQTVTSDGGTYDLSNIPPGTYNLVASGAGYDFVEAGVVIAPGANTHSFQLTSSQTRLHGRVVDKDGAPIAGALVQVYSSDNVLLGQTTTDIDGKWEITSAYGTNLSIRISYKEVEPIELGAEIEHEEDKDEGDILYDISNVLIGPFLFTFTLPNFDPSTFRIPWGDLLWPDITNRIKNYDKSPYHVDSVPDLGVQCKECQDARDAAVKAKQAQDKAHDKLDEVKKETLKKLDETGAEIIENAKEFIGILASFVSGLGEFCAAFQAEKSLLEILKVDEEKFEFVDAFVKLTGDTKSFIDVILEILDPNSDPKKAKSLLTQASTSARTIADVMAQLMLIIDKEAGKSFGKFNNVFSVVTRLVDYQNTFDLLTFGPANRAADECVKQLSEYYDKKIEYEEKAIDAYGKLEDYKRCARNSAASGNKNCNPNPPPGPPPGGPPGFPGGPPGRAHGAGAGDPNDIIGPDGFGAQNFVGLNRTFPYLIEFENVPSATANATKVVVTQQLDSHLDWNTFQLGAIQFGRNVVAVPSGHSSFHTVYDDTANTGVFVDISASIDLTTGIATWIFTSIDPITGDLPDAVDQGFLPPDIDGLVGQASVAYLIQPKSSDITADQIHAQASIVFDLNGAIPTQIIVNTIDAGAPSSHVNVLPAQSPLDFNVSWTGTDDASPNPAGSGIASYDIYVQIDNGPFIPFLLGTTDTSAPFHGLNGHTYKFYSIATDNVGHVESAPASPDATTLTQDIVPPTVIAAEYSGHTPIPVPGLRYLTIHFSENVQPSLAISDLLVHNTTTNQDATPASLQYDAASNTAVITFGALPDGNYVLTVLSDGVTDAAGNALDGNGDGLAGGNYTFNFFELLGDLDRDRKVDDIDRQQLTALIGTGGVRPQDGDANGDHNVDFADLVAVAQHYGQTGLTLAQGDFNGDGAVDFADLVIVAQHYGRAGRGDLNGDNIINQTDLDILNANFGHTLPAPGAAIPAPAMAAPLPVSPASLPDTVVTNTPLIAATAVATAAPHKLSPRPNFSPVARPQPRLKPSLIRQVNHAPAGKAAKGADPVSRFAFSSVPIRPGTSSTQSRKWFDETGSLWV